MARPRAKELTERELEVMHAFWELGQVSVAQIQDHLDANGRPLAYTTVATLVKILHDKGFLQQTNELRPFTYAPDRSFDEVSGNMLTDLVQRVFQGSRERLLVQLFGNEELTPEERERLKDLLEEQEP